MAASVLPLPLCRVCRIRPATSDEHFIPKATGNRRIVRTLSIAEGGAWRERRFSGGAKTHVLCIQCNNGIGSSYAQAYTDVYRQLRLAARLLTPDGRLLFAVCRFHPLRFVKQAILAYLCVAAWEPQPIWEPLQRFVHDRDAPLPTSAPRIYLYYNSSRLGRVVPSCTIGSLAGHKPTSMSEISWPPLGMVLSYDAHPALDAMFDVTDWGSASFAERRDVSLVLPELRVNTIYPLAFGSNRAIERQQLQRLPIHLMYVPPGSTNPFRFPVLLRRT